MAREAVSVAAGTDLVLDHAEACLAMSRVLGAAGDAQGARSARADAERLYAAKEVANAIARVADPVTEPSHVATAPGPTLSRLAVTNKSCEFVPEIIAAMQAHDVDGTIRHYSERLAYSDHRRLAAGPIVGSDAMRKALALVFEHYKHVEFRILAVRGERLHLMWTRLSDDSGNQESSLFVNETDVDGRIVYQSRFDDDDFEGAYGELTDRYYADEGAAFAETGALLTATFVALNRGEYDRVLGELSAPDVRIENRSHSVLPDQSTKELHASWTELNAMVSSSRIWPAAVCWLTPQLNVARIEREAMGHDGEHYSWAFLLVQEVKDGLGASMCQFDLEDEEAAFAYAEEKMRASMSRLAVTNQVSPIASALFAALRAYDVEAAIACYAEQFVHDEHRKIGGAPIRGHDAMRAALARLLEDYSQFEYRVMAVRGERLALSWYRFSDDDGNESVTYNVNEIGDDGRVAYQGRFDEDDFEGAYRELERRYYEGEGAAFGDAGLTNLEWTLALNGADFDRMFGEFTAPDLRVENRSRSAFPDRSAAEYRATLEELASMVVSSRSWVASMHWLSPTWCITRCEREAVGRDGEHFNWSFVIVYENRDGRLTSMCEFDVDDEEAAFAYAEERMRAATSRLAVTNQCCEASAAFFAAMRAHDIDGAAECYADQYLYEDRRKISGGPLHGRAALRKALSRVFAQFTSFEFRVLAVRGQRLNLMWNRWSDDRGNQSITLNVNEIGEDGFLYYSCRFDEDDLEGAYSELERRYYSGEGVAFADAGELMTNWILAMNQGDFDRIVGEFTTPDMSIENRSSSALPDLSAGEIRATLEDLETMVASAQTWVAALHWLSPTVFIGRYERKAVGRDGETYTWTQLCVSELRDGRTASVCQFDVDDEEAAFAYAEERMRASTSRLAVTNASCNFLPAFIEALRARDVDGVVSAFAEGFEYDDRRRLSDDPIVGHEAMQAAVRRIFEQYNQFDFRVLAVRGDRLNLLWSRWGDDDGNETTTLYVNETDDDGRVYYHARFDEEDFVGAYRELERRYYAGEGAAFASGGAVGAEWVIALNDGDFDRLFGELTDPDFRLESRMLSVFGEPSADELRNSFEELNTMVASARAWCSALHWLSPAWAVARLEREAIGDDGETYAWARLHVIEIRGGRLASDCRFDLEDEESAFAYAEERIRATTGRLAVSNRASDVVIPFFDALNAHDADAALDCVSDQFVFDDHRRLSGDAVVGRAAMRVAIGRVLEQYTHFESHVLAVRGERVTLVWSRFSDDDGNEMVNLNAAEIDDDGLGYYLGRFDEDDFEGAYQELERRYYAGDGAEFAEGGAVSTATVVALNRGDYDLLISDLTTPEMRIENRSRSGFPNGSANDLRTSWDELDAMVSSSCTWFSVVHWMSPQWTISRLDREAIGRDGELYSWAFLLVAEVKDGRSKSLCQFDLDDEEAAFAYADERMRATTSRLAVANSAGETVTALVEAIVAGDADRAIECYAASFAYDDYRSISGDPIDDNVAMRAALGRLLEQYSHFEAHTLAVRGDRLHLGYGRFSSDSGYETTYLIVHEVVEGLISYEGRFDEDNFEGAYRELERRYYAGEGAEFAEIGAVGTEFVIALNTLDFERMSDTVSEPDFRIENRSSSALTHRSFAEFRTSLKELDAMVESARTWNSALFGVSPNCAVARQEREAVGPEGEKYVWSRLVVSEFDNGRFTLICEFDVDDEEAAFAYAEERMRSSTKRLSVSNRASRTSRALVAALNDSDLDSAAGCFSDRFVLVDRRRLGGNPLDDMRVALRQIMLQYSHFEMRTLAVRGNSLHLMAGRWSDDSGNETSYLHVQEVDDAGLMIREAHFDEDDFEGAYRELELRYYAGEGAAFAEMGSVGTDCVIAVNRLDFDLLSRTLSESDFRMENRSRSPLPDRSAAEFRASLEELNAMVASARTWNSAMFCLSPTVAVLRQEREAIGLDGETFTWTRLIVTDSRNGRIARLCEFDVEDEEAAFVYARERMLASTGLLSMTNHATQTAEMLRTAMALPDLDGAIACYADSFVYDDKRGLSGDPIRDKATLRSAFDRILTQYRRFDGEALAVRGDRLWLGSGCFSNDAKYESKYLFVHEIDEHGRIIYHGCFDEKDFEGAYRELDRRYFAGEGEAFARSAYPATEWITALNNADYDRAFGELSTPDMRVENRSRATFPDRSASDLRATFEELSERVASSRTWLSAMHWLSADWLVARLEREAAGLGGEHFQWLRVHVIGFSNGKMASVCQFEIDDVEQAIAYAKDRMRARPGRLAVENRASETCREFVAALNADELERAVQFFADDWKFDDRRRLAGNALANAHAAVAGIMAQYTSFELRTFAVRGERLHLCWSRWSDDSGNQTVHLHVQEVDHDGHFAYEARFDEDDFENAYRELNRRYYASEGAAFAAAGAIVTEYVTALHRGDLDRAVGELSAPDFRLENRSRSVFGDRTGAEFRATQEELNTMVTSVRTFNSAICWLSPAIAVSRFEREALGRDDERYIWNFIIVSEIRGGRVAKVRQFDIEDETAAFEYAEEQIRTRVSRLPVTNLAKQTWDKVGRVSAAHHADAMAECYAEDCEFDDRRWLRGSPPDDIREAAGLILEQHTQFEGRSLAVRGEHLHLGWARWSNDSGYETANFLVHEVDDDGRIVYEGQFDENSFAHANLAFEQRYYAEEGAAFAESAVAITESVFAFNTGDLDRMFELAAPEMRYEVQSRSVIPSRSVAEMRAGLEDLHTWVSALRSWFAAVRWLSPSCCVARNEREAVGHDGEKYSWSKLYVVEIRDGLGISSYEFEPDDEEAAFAYAEERVRAAATRLPTSNRASRAGETVQQALRNRDAASAAACYSASFEYSDRRSLGGNPPKDMRMATERVLEQYTHFQGRTLAVRGEKSALGWTRWSDASGFETTYFSVHEVDDDGLIYYACRFDEDDFAAAYRELDQRYYSGEGEAFAEAGAVATEWVVAVDRGDLNRAFTTLSAPDLHFEIRSSSALPASSTTQARAALEELNAMLTSSRTWNSALRWVSPTCCVSRNLREAIGHDGEPYTWTRLFVLDIRDGRMASVCEFDIEDEDGAFAYAEERVHAAQSRLAVTNRAKQTMDAIDRASQAGDFASAAAFYPPSLVYDDRRRLSGHPIGDMRSAIERIAEQYSQYEFRTLAVRGDNLHLGWTRWVSESGFESSSLWVHEIGDDGQMVYQCRFDEDDFNSAYRELTRRYCAGEGADVAAGAFAGAEWLIGLNNRELDRVFGELTDPEAQIENRSSSAFPDRSARDLRSSFEDLYEIVTSARSWNSAECWLNATCAVIRRERQAIGKDGEQYAWTKLYVLEIRDSRITGWCEFTLEDEAAAFAYAEERIRRDQSR